MPRTAAGKALKQPQQRDIGISGIGGIGGTCGMERRPGVVAAAPAVLAQRPGRARWSR